MASDETRYTNKIFMAAALPLMKTIATDVPELKKKFEGVMQSIRFLLRLMPKIRKQSILSLKTVNGVLNSANISVRKKLMPSSLFLQWKR